MNPLRYQVASKIGGKNQVFEAAFIFFYRKLKQTYIDLGSISDKFTYILLYFARFSMQEYECFVNACSWD
jgi:hypothetical protein